MVFAVLVSALRPGIIGTAQFRTVIPKTPCPVDFIGPDNSFHDAAPDSLAGICGR